MKYHVDGFVVFRGSSFAGVADGLNDARFFAAELNRLAEERDALLEACRLLVNSGILPDLDSLPRTTPTLAGNVSRAVRAAIAKAEGGEA